MKYFYTLITSALSVFVITNSAAAESDISGQHILLNGAKFFPDMYCNSDCRKIYSLAYSLFEQHALITINEDADGVISGFVSPLYGYPQAKIPISGSRSGTKIQVSISGAEYEFDDVSKVDDLWEAGYSAFRRHFEWAEAPEKEDHLAFCVSCSDAKSDGYFTFVNSGCGPETGFMGISLTWDISERQRNSGLDRLPDQLRKLPVRQCYWEKGWEFGENRETCHNDIELQEVFAAEKYEKIDRFRPHYLAFPDHLTTQMFRELRESGLVAVATEAPFGCDAFIREYVTLSRYPLSPDADILSSKHSMKAMVEQFMSSVAVLSTEDLGFGFSYNVKDSMENIGGVGAIGVILSIVSPSEITRGVEGRWDAFDLILLSYQRPSDPLNQVTVEVEIENLKSIGRTTSSPPSQSWFSEAEELSSQDNRTAVESFGYGLSIMFQ